MEMIPELDSALWRDDGEERNVQREDGLEQMAKNSGKFQKRHGSEEYLLRSTTRIQKTSHQ